MSLLCIMFHVSLSPDCQGQMDKSSTMLQQKCHYPVSPQRSVKFHEDYVIAHVEVYKRQPRLLLPAFPLNGSGDGKKGYITPKSLCSSFSQHGSQWVELDVMITILELITGK